MTHEQLKRIIYVEDDPDIQLVTSKVLQKLGNFELCICSSGPQALESIVDFAPQLVLLDVMMPEMDGPETLEEIRKIESCSNIPVIFMTARVQQQDIEEYMALGAIGVVQKPFDPGSLCDEIMALWSKADQN